MTLVVAGRPKASSSIRSRPTPMTAPLGFDADADRAGDARAADTAVALRVLGQVLLVIVLGEVERRGGGDLGRDLAEALGRQRLLIGLQRGDRLGGLRVARDIEARAVLGADVVALAHALGRVVVFPEHLQELAIG